MRGVEAIQCQLLVTLIDDLVPSERVLNVTEGKGEAGKRGTSQ